MLTRWEVSRTFMWTGTWKTQTKESSALFITTQHEKKRIQYEEFHWAHNCTMVTQKLIIRLSRQCRSTWDGLNPIALRTAKPLWSFVHSECNRDNLWSFGHSECNRVNLWSFGHSECNRVNLWSFGHSECNRVNVPVHLDLCCLQIQLSSFLVGWLVVLGLTALWDSIPIYIGPGERKEKWEMREKMSKNPPPAHTASTVGPCPTLIQISRMPRHWKFTQQHRTTRPAHLHFWSCTVCPLVFKFYTQNKTIFWHLAQ